MSQLPITALMKCLEGHTVDTFASSSPVSEVEMHPGALNGSGSVRVPYPPLTTSASLSCAPSACGTPVVAILRAAPLPMVVGTPSDPQGPVLTLMGPKAALGLSLETGPSRL